LKLIDEGVIASAVAWEGGEGIVVSDFSDSGASLQASFDGCLTWQQVTPIRESINSIGIVAMTIAFKLPACFLRMNGTITGTGSTRAIRI